MKTTIITKNKVDKTFEGEECLLLRTITKVIKEGNYKKYIILTERCNYYTEKIQVFNSETGKPVYDENNQEIFEDVLVLKILDKKDKEGVLKSSFEDINKLYNLIKNQVPENLSKMETENLEEQLALLIITQQEEPWNTQASDWEILN